MRVRPLVLATVMTAVSMIVPDPSYGLPAILEIPADRPEGVTTTLPAGSYVVYADGSYLYDGDPNVDAIGDVTAGCRVQAKRIRTSDRTERPVCRGRTTTGRGNMSTTAADAHTAERLLDAVNAIAPVIREHAAEGEHERSLSPAVVDAMRGAGLFKLARPKAFGGLELDPVSTFRVVEEIARHDSAAAWNVSLSTGGDCLLAWLPDAGAAEILRSPDVVLAGAFFPSGTATAADDGYRLSGRWSFLSGCQHAQWILVVAVVMDGGAPALDEQANPTQIMAWLPAEEATILDTWHTLGMRSTGSNDIEVDDLLVPTHRTAPLLPLTTPGTAFGGAPYRLTVWAPIALLAPPALGIARAAIDEFVELARNKTPSFTGSSLRDRQVVQRQVAEATAHLAAGRAFLHESLGCAWQDAVNGRPIDLTRKLQMQLATSHAIRCAADAVDLIHAAAGTSSIHNRLNFQRHFRDVHTITQHAFGSAQRYESVGALLLGAESDWGFFPF